MHVQVGASDPATVRHEALRILPAVAGVAQRPFKLHHVWGTSDWELNAERLVPGGEKLAAEMTLEDMRMTVVERVSEWPKQWVREGLQRGLEQGIKQGIDQGSDQGRNRGAGIAGAHGGVPVRSGHRGARVGGAGQHFRPRTLGRGRRVARAKRDGGGISRPRGTDAVCGRGTQELTSEGTADCGAHDGVDVGMRSRESEQLLRAQPVGDKHHEVALTPRGDAPGHVDAPSSVPPHPGFPASRSPTRTEIDGAVVEELPDGGHMCIGAVGDVDVGAYGGIGGVG